MSRFFLHVSSRSHFCLWRRMKLAGGRVQKSGIGVATHCLHHVPRLSLGWLGLQHHLQRAVKYQSGTHPSGTVPCRHGAKVPLIEPYHEGAFCSTKEVEAAPVVSPAQLCLDPTQTKERGKEAASATLEEVTKPQGADFSRLLRSDCGGCGGC